MNAAVEKAASDWLARLDRGLSPEEAERLAAWKAADPRHEAEFARLADAWQVLDTMGEVPEIRGAAAEMEERHARARRSWRGYSWAVAAAAAVAVAWTLSLSFGPAKPERTSGTIDVARSYEIVPGVAQRMTLPDGTVIELNRDSKVEPVFSPDERRVRLVRGEAFFTVAKDPGRPFIVQTEHVSVRAVGTAFNVRMEPASVEVLVTEGKVRLDDPVNNESLLVSAETMVAGVPAGPPVLIAGQRVVVVAGAAQPVVPVAATPEDLHRAQEWQSMRFLFQRTPLAEVVDAFNRHNSCQLVLGDEALRLRRVSGAFRADNVDAFVRLLETGFEIGAERRSENEIVLHHAR